MVVCITWLAYAFVYAITKISTDIKLNGSVLVGMPMVKTVQLLEKGDKQD